ncbi:MAG: endolytic transglycosylase MltG [Coriobacteriia bacterium]|nr:endolytic transglycosylase MltG [Coriobacteriia bacterium]
MSDAPRPRPRRSDRRRQSPSRRVQGIDERSRRRMLTAVVVLVSILLAIAIPAYGAWQLLIKPQVNVEPGLPVQVEIPEGAGTREIATILADKGVIDNAAMFRLRARTGEIDGKLRPGIYDLATGMPYEAVVEKLLAGPPIPYVTVTIPEGYRLEQIAARYEEIVGIPASEFLELANGQAQSFSARHPYLVDVETGSLEGYLFPKTYRIVEGSTASDVIEIMLDQFELELAEVDLAEPTVKGLSLHEVVTIASMVEREAKIAEERPLISSVIYNRIAKGMRLEIDATIEYVLQENRPRLLNKDLEIDSPYNTYKYGGLPPGPIASPGLASLQAAAQPVDTEYIYYVLTSADGSHTFATNYQDFLKAKEKSREVTP